MKRIFLAALCVLTGVSNYGQAQTMPAAVSSCTLSPAKAPAIRGVNLGMKVHEVLALFPGSAENNDIKAALAKAEGFPNFGLASIYIYPRDYSTKDRFAGIASIQFMFFDGRVDQYEVDYDLHRAGPFGGESTIGSPSFPTRSNYHQRQPGLRSRTCRIERL